MPDLQKISFIICSYNRASYLRDTLASLLAKAGKHNAFEIIVIDNNSTDETADMVRHFIAEHTRFTIRYFYEQRQGLSHARNRGIKEANAHNIVFLDDDIFATDTLIPAWQAFFDENSGHQVAGGKIHVHFDDPRPKWMSHFLLPLLGHHDLGDRQKTYPANKYPFGGNMGFQRSLFEEVGYFDVSLGRQGEKLKAGEEKELFQRLRKHVKNIHYLPKALLLHRVNADRLTIDYIRKQALGLGHSMRLQLENGSGGQQFKNWLKEIGKLLASVPLALLYLCSLNPHKALLLFQFRWWIWRGYKTTDN